MTQVLDRKTLASDTDWLAADLSNIALIDKVKEEGIVLVRLPEHDNVSSVAFGDTGTHPVETVEVHGPANNIDRIVGLILAKARAVCAQAVIVGSVFEMELEDDAATDEILPDDQLADYKALPAAKRIATVCRVVFVPDTERWEPA